MLKKTKIGVGLAIIAVFFGIADIFVLKWHEEIKAQTNVNSQISHEVIDELAVQIKDYTRPLAAMAGLREVKQLTDKLKTTAANLEKKILTTEMVVTRDQALVGKKLVALTFDDGPKPETTKELLQYLKSQQVPATFFVLGSQANRYPEIVKQAYDDGNQIGSHTYNHLNLPKLSEAQQKDEISQTATLIQKIVGKYPNLLRPPYGAFNDQISKATNAGLALWNVDSLDWQSKNPDAIYNTVMSNVTDGSIILMHDIYSTSVAGVKKLIPALKQQGYTFVTMNQLIGARSEFRVGQAYYKVAPDGKLR